MNKTGFTICKYFPVPVFICRLSQYLPPCSSARPVSLSCIHRHARLRVRRPFLYPSPCSSARPAAFSAAATPFRGPSGRIPFLRLPLFHLRCFRAKNTKIQKTQKRTPFLGLSPSRQIFILISPETPRQDSVPFIYFFPNVRNRQSLRRSVSQSLKHSDGHFLIFPIPYLSSFSLWTTDGRFYAARSSPASPSPRRR